MEYPFCSILVVNYNGKKHLEACLSSFEQLRYPAEQLEILLVDNGSDDGSELAAVANHPRVRLLRNPRNNFAAALNLGISHAQGSYIAFANNDVFVDSEWLAELVRVLEENPRAGCAGGKILFENGRINSAGHRPLPDFYWDDEGYDEEDRGQYDAAGEREGLCWAAVLFRKSCLADLGPLDEDFVLYYEDVDASLRCRQRSWKVLYTPQARACHVFHGSSQGSRLADYFCDRGRLIYVAKHHPDRLAQAVESSRFVIQQFLDELYDALPVILKKLFESHPAQTVEKVVEELSEVLVRLFGSLAVDHLLARMEVILGIRKMSVGFYDQAMHVIGGGQRYGCTMAAALQDQFDVTLIASKPVEQADLEEWYGLHLSRCRMEQIPLPYFDRFGAWIDANAVTPDVANPFEPIAAASQGFDIFVNVNMLTMIRPLSPFSVFLCHFPDTVRRCYFAVDEYSCLLVNSRYTGQWVNVLWGLEPSLLLHPPVDMTVPPAAKENIILSVARFEPGGSKKQRELIQAFEQLRTSDPQLLAGWRLVLAGGSLPQNHYLLEVQRMARESKAPVTVCVNLSLPELQRLYATAKIFWHACGLGETDAHLIEHFGMTTVEAMQNRCVPIVINGGGQREIVEHGQSGYRFATLAELCQHTRKVIATPGLMEQLREAAFERSQNFTRQHFEAFVRLFFQALEEEYRTIPVPDPGEILQDRHRPNVFYSAAARHARPAFPPAVEPLRASA
jgi:GT2 family glycosyltransferase